MILPTLSAVSLLLLAIAFPAARAVALPHRRATVCNGQAALCSRSYGNTTFLASHDSAFFDDDPLALARDQEVDVPTQLSLGVRMLQAQAHVENGELRFCHTSCLLFDGGLVSDYLKNVKTFLDQNPHEVLTLLFTNPDSASLTDMWAPAFAAAGVDSFAFVPPSPGTPIKQSEWPTLGELIESGKRVVVFLDKGSTGLEVPYIMPEFDMIWEPPFSVTDPSFPCSVNRISGPLATTDHLYMLNHNLNKKVFGSSSVLISDPIDAPTTNGVASILANAYGCVPYGGGRSPAFVMLDYVDIGQGKHAVDILNGFASA